MTDSAADQRPLDDPEDAEPTRRPFAVFLTGWENGLLHAELTDLLPDLLEAVKLNERAGTLTITVSAKPVKNGDQVAISVAAKAKIPEPEPMQRAMWVDDAGNPVGQDPRQLQIPMVAAVPRHDQKPIRPKGAKS